MSVTTQKGPRATLADFLAIPEEERFHELIDGEVIEKASPNGAHGRAQSRVTIRVGGPFDRRPGGRWPGGWWFATDVEIAFGDDICRPDVVAWRRDKVPVPPSEAITHIVPDWTCEILSTNRRNDLVRKKRIYHRHGVSNYWVLDPLDEMLVVNRWTPEGYFEVLAASPDERVRAEPFEAIELPVAVLFGADEDD